MSIAVFNQWVNGHQKKADILAALDKVLVPEPVNDADLERMRDVARAVNAERVAGFTGAISCFRQMHGRELAAARPQHVALDVWAETLRWAYTKVRGISTRLASAWLYAGVFKDGPKVYCPTLTEWEALARVELRIPLAAYRQPFPTTVVIIPDGAFGVVSKEVGTPSFCIVRHWNHGDNNGIISGLVVGNNSVEYELDFRVMWIEGGTEELEARLKQIETASASFTGWDSVDDQTDENRSVGYAMAEGEPAAMEKIKRAVLNACLLLSQHAPRLIGKQNPEHAEKLKRKPKKASAAALAANARQLHLMPTVYGFHQHIVVCEHVREPDDDPNATGTHPPKKPHWRRGHWLHQVCGTGRTERKLQFRPAKLVNEHLLSGPRHNTRVTMTTG